MECIVHGVAKSQTRLSYFPFENIISVSIPRDFASRFMEQTFLYPYNTAISMPIGATKCLQCHKIS